MCCGTNCPPTLDLDTLLHAMGLVEDRPTLLSLLRTCRTLYSAGSPYLLTYPLNLDSQGTALSFCTWMLSDSDTNSERRFRHFRQLSFSMLFNDDDGGRDSSNLFATLLRRATNLKDLSFETTTDFMDSVTQEFLTALQSLDIHVLRIKYTGPNTVKFLKSMRSLPVSLDISFP